MNDEERKCYFMRTHLGMSPAEIAKVENTPSLTATSLSYNRTYEEETEERRKLDLAVSYLEGLGVEVVSEYGHYRNIYNVLKDLGECLDQKQEYNSSLLKTCKNYLCEE